MPKRKTVWYEPPARAVKKLQISDEEFFAAALLLFGPPKTAPLHYKSKAYKRGVGLWFWMTETKEGEAFTNFVSKCGDAKHRATMIYRAWYQWFESEKRNLKK